MGSADQLENFYFTEAQDRQRTYAFYVKGLIKGALKNLGAGIGGQPIEVQIYDLGSNNQNLDKPFELDIKVDMPPIENHIGGNKLG